MIKMIIAPLLFSTLVVGIAGTGDLKAMGRIGLKAIVYFEVATTIALVPRPGARQHLQAGRRPGAADRRRHRRGSRRWRRASSSGWDILLHLFPTSVVDAMARGDILQVVVFSIVLRHRARRDRRARGSRCSTCSTARRR